MSEFELHNQFSMTSGHPRHERPMWIWDQDSASFVWANGEGVKFWSALSLERLQAMAFDKSHPAWVAVCRALASDEYLAVAERSRGIDLELQFPDNGSGLNWAANCRRGLLQDRNAIIVELKGAAPLSIKEPAEITTNSSDRDEPATMNGTDSFATFSKPDRDIHDGDVPDSEKTDGQSDGHDEGSPLSEAHLLDSLLDNMTISDEAIAALKSSIQPLSNESSSVKINGVWIGEQSGVESDASPDNKGSKYSPFDRANFDKSRRLVSRAPKEQLHELARLIKEAGASELLEADAAIMNEAGADAAIAPAASDQEENPAQSNFNNNGVGSEISSDAPVPTGSVDMIALGGVGDQDELERILDTANEPVALISLQKMLHANPLFVAEFGYGDITSLINDGSDWIFPSSRDVLTGILEGHSFNTTVHQTNENERGVSGSVLNQVRLRSGRRMSRDVWFTPVRLVKFDRTLLLVRLADQFKDLADETPADTVAFEDTDTEQLDLSSVPLMSSISHEVRTPLNVIIGFSELMTLEQFGPLGNEKYHGYAKDIHSSALHALSLINDLLDLTKLKAGKWEISKEPLDLNEVVRSQVSMMREMAAQKSLRLRSDLEENLPLVMLDKRGINQILLNLLSNAIKFNNEFGRIIVETERIDMETIRLSVRDTGMGMSEAEIAQAMEPFHQVARDPLSKGGAFRSSLGSSIDCGKGTGLGLPIAKALAEANDVDFSIVSEKDTGTEITLLIKVLD